MKLHRKHYPPEFVEELLRRQIEEFTWRIRGLVVLQWLSIIFLLCVIADTFIAFIWDFSPIMPLGQKLVSAIICGGAIYSNGWAMGYLEDLRDDSEISLEKLLFGEVADDGE